MKATHFVLTISREEHMIMEMEGVIRLAIAVGLFLLFRKIGRDIASREQNG